MFDAGSIEMQITYPTKTGTQNKLAFKVPANATVQESLSKCGHNLTNEELNETLTVIFTVFGPVIVTLRFEFTRDPFITGDKTLDKSQLYNIIAEYHYDTVAFPDIDPKWSGKSVTATSNVTLHEFSVLKDRSYQCNSLSTIKLDEKVTLVLTGVRAQAFLTKDNFSAAEPCSADAHSSDLVPIIIGAVLAAIVLLVLIAYLIGRARMRRTTYESI